jgi:hypothetical protein
MRHDQSNLVLVGLGIITVVSNWIENWLEAPDLFLTIVIPLAIFSILATISGTRLTRRLRLESEPVLEIDENVYRYDRSSTVESIGLVITNIRNARAINCEGHLSELKLLLSGTSQSISRWPTGKLQWLSLSRTSSQQAGLTDIGSHMKANLEVILHTNAWGFRQSGQSTASAAFNRTKYLIAYANDEPLMFENPPPSQELLMLITVKADNGPPIYAVCQFNPNPNLQIMEGLADAEGVRKISGTRDPILKVLTISRKRPCLSCFQCEAVQ